VLIRRRHVHDARFDALSVLGKHDWQRRGPAEDLIEILLRARTPVLDHDHCTQEVRWQAGEYPPRRLDAAG
jgi:hypothetical protein